LSALDEGLGDPVGADDAKVENHFDCCVSVIDMSRR
jgi:hypothetical protein